MSVETSTVSEFTCSKPFRNILHFPPRVLISTSDNKRINVHDLRSGKLIKDSGVFNGIVTDIIKFSDDTFFACCENYIRGFQLKEILKERKKFVKIFDGKMKDKVLKILKLCDSKLLVFIEGGIEFFYVVDVKSKTAKGILLETELYTCMVCGCLARSLKNSLRFYFSSKKRSENGFLKVLLVNSESGEILKEYSDERLTDGEVAKCLTSYVNSKKTEILVVGTAEYFLNGGSGGVVVFFHSETGNKVFKIGGVSSPSSFHIFQNKYLLVGGLQCLGLLEFDGEKFEGSPKLLFDGYLHGNGYQSSFRKGGIISDVLILNRTHKFFKIASCLGNDGKLKITIIHCESKIEDIDQLERISFLTDNFYEGCQFVLDLKTCKFSLSRVLLYL